MDFGPVNSSWDQTQVYLLDDISRLLSITTGLTQEQIIILQNIEDILKNSSGNTGTNNITNNIDNVENINFNSGSTVNNYTSGRTEEIIFNVVTVLPQQTIFNTIQTMLAPMSNPPKVIVKYSSIAPPPIIINIEKKSIYGKICGNSSVDSNYVNCTNCVDKWLIDNPNYLIGDLTSTNTGCSCNNKIHKLLSYNAIRTPLAQWKINGCKGPKPIK